MGHLKLHLQLPSILQIIREQEQGILDTSKKTFFEFCLFKDLSLIQFTWFGVNMIQRKKNISAEKLKNKRYVSYLFIMIVFKHKCTLRFFRQNFSSEFLHFKIIDVDIIQYILGCPRNSF